MNKRKIILAGNHQQFDEYLAETGQTNSDCVYGNFHCMHGVIASEVVVIGTFWERNDASAAHEYALSRVR